MLTSDITSDHAMQTIPTGQTVTITCQQCDGDKMLRQPYFARGACKVRIIRDQPCSACAGTGTRDVPEMIDPRDVNARPCHAQLIHIRFVGPDQVYPNQPGIATKAAFAGNAWWLRVDGGSWQRVYPQEDRYCRIGKYFAIRPSGRTVEETIFSGQAE